MKKTESPSTALAPAEPQRYAAIVAGLQTTFEAAKTERSTVQFRRALAGLVFAYWAAKFTHPRSLFDPKRERIIMQRLKEADDDVSQLLYAIDGLAKDAFMMGQDPRRSGPPLDAIEMLFRDRAHVERWGERCKGWAKHLPHPLALKHVPGVKDQGALGATE